MKRSDLVEMGLSDEIADRIISLYNETIKSNFIPKARFEEVNEAKKNAELLLKERDSQLDSLKKSTNDVDKLKDEISKLQDANKAAEKDYQARIYALRLDNAVEMELRNARAKNVRAVRGLLNNENIKLDGDGKVVGLEEQIKSLLESDPYLFATQDDKSTVAKITGYVPANGRPEAPNPQNVTFQSRLEEARKNNDTLMAITIKQEAAAAGVTLF